MMDILTSYCLFTVFLCWGLYLNNIILIGGGGVTKKIIKDNMGEGDLLKDNDYQLLNNIILIGGGGVSQKVI